MFFKLCLLTFSVLSQSLAQTWVHTYAITSRTKEAVYTNFQLWIYKTAIFNLTPSGVTSHLTLTISCVLNRPSWPLLSRVGDLCNHVSFTDVATPRGCWRLFEQKQSLDSRLREGAERSEKLRDPDDIDCSDALRTRERQVLSLHESIWDGTPRFNKGDISIELLLNLNLNLKSHLELWMSENVYQCSFNW
jgi:hypothetical protein